MDLERLKGASILRRVDEGRYIRVVGELTSTESCMARKRIGLTMVKTH